MPGCLRRAEAPCVTVDHGGAPEGDDQASSIDETLRINSSASYRNTELCLPVGYVIFHQSDFHCD